MIRGVVFDLGNVVCAFRPERRIEALARTTGIRTEEIHEVIWASGLDSRAEAGELSPAEVTRALLDGLDNRIDSVTLRAAWSTAFILDAAVSAIVKSLDRPSFVFTNNGPMLSECLAHELNAVAELFDRVICSWQVRARKPELIAFERLCAELQRRPEELLFIDDDIQNTESARSAGLTALSFTSAERLASDLDEFRGR